MVCLVKAPPCQPMKCRTCASQDCSFLPSTPRTLKLPKSPNKSSKSKKVSEQGSKHEAGGSEKEKKEKKEKKKRSRIPSKSSPSSPSTGRDRPRPPQVSFERLEELIEMYKAKTRGVNKAFLLHRVRIECDDLGLDFELLDL